MAVRQHPAKFSGQFEVFPVFAAGHNQRLGNEGNVFLCPEVIGYPI